MKLTGEEQKQLKTLASMARAAAYKQTHALILLLSDVNHAEGPMLEQEVARAPWGAYGRCGAGVPTLSGPGRRGGHRAQEAAEPPLQKAGWRWRGPPDGFGLLQAA